VEKAQKRNAKPRWCGDIPDRGPWKLLRLDTIAVVERRKWPLSRVELFHEKRGRVLDVSTGAGSLDAAFIALSTIVGVKATVRAAANAEIEIAVGDAIYRGSARTADLFLSAVGAYLEAISLAAAD
jgi:hypothetical protein